MKKVLVVVFCILLPFFSSCDNSTEPSDPGYTAYMIKSITLNKIPATDENGAGWDNSGGPDIYFQITNSDMSQMLFNGESSVFNDLLIPQNLPVTWNLTPPLSVVNIDAGLNLFFYDEDAAFDDLMQGVTIRGSDMKNGDKYPTTVKLTDIYGGQFIEVTLNIAWSK